MAIKTKSSRDTYRSNVKARPLRQNGLEAQYQGLDVKEVNIDHSGLPILARGGFQNPRNFTKVFKEYIVDVDADEHYPRAALMFENRRLLGTCDQGDSSHHNDQATCQATAGHIWKSTWDYDAAAEAYVGINELATENVTFTLTDSGGTFKTFHYTTDITNTNGLEMVNPSLTANDIAVVIPDESFSYRDTMMITTGSIEEACGKETFSFQLLTSGSMEVVDMSGRSNAGIFRVTETEEGKTAVPVTKDKILISLKTTVMGAAALATNKASFFDVTTDTFGDQSEKHKWRLNNFREQTTNDQMFYEDLRTDILQSFAPHERRKEGILFKPTQVSRGALDDTTTSGDDGFHVGGIIVNADGHMNSRAGNGQALDPKTLDRFTTKESDELLIRQTPKRQEVFGTFRDNHIWREDRHFLSMVDQRWEQIEQRALLYDSDFESHMIAMLDTNFADEQYFEDNPLSGRVDVFGRLSRIFDTHNEIIYERHRGSVFDQFLHPINDYSNLQDNKYPKADTTQEYTQTVYNHTTLADEQINHTNDPAFEDVQGKRRTLQADTAAAGELEIKFYSLPKEGDKIVLQVGNGWGADTSIEIKFNRNGTHDTSFQALGSAGVVDLEVEVLQFIGQIANLRTHIALKLIELQTTTINEVSLAQYAVTEVSSTTIKLIPYHPGVGWDIIATSMLNNSNDIAITLTSGIDSLWARENSVMFMDYFDQLPMEAHDYSETERYTRIDDDMLKILTFDENRDTHIDRREWQESDYLYTSTGFVSSQVTPQDGIIYREMKR